MMHADIVVLGAGIGGLAAAISLARRGWRVAIVEKQARLTPKVGESFDWETGPLLNALGVDLDNLLARAILTEKPGVVIWSDSTHDHNRANLLPPPVYMKLLRRRPVAFHGDRSRLDRELLARAVELGCRVVTARIARVCAVHDRVVGIELDSDEAVNGDFFVDASGRTKLLTRACGAKFEFYSDQMISLSRRHEHDYDGQGTRLYFIELEGRLVWAWNIHVSSDKTDIGVVVPRTVYGVVGTKGERADDIYWRIVDAIPPCESS